MVLKKLKNIPNTTIVQADPLTKFVGSLFAAAGMPPSEAVEAAAVLVDADLNGIDSHGVGYNLDLHYLGGLMSGYINATPDIRITRETPSTAVVDADRGMGLLAGIFAMNVAIDKARETGTASVAVPNSSHYGAAGYYSRMALEHDMIGMTVSSGGGRVIIPMGGRDPWMGTNPFSMAAPADKEPAFVIDMASSVTSFGKVSIARHLGIKIPEGWAVTEDGQPITDPANSPPAHGQPPLGVSHEQGAHKGYGIGMMADILGAILPGETVSGLLPDNPRGGRFCHYFQAIRIDAFRPAAEFKADMDEYLTELLECPTATGEGRVLYYRFHEAETTADREQNGIPYHPEVIDWFKEATSEHNLEWKLT